jgi:hypothetical protein
MRAAEYLVKRPVIKVLENLNRTVRDAKRNDLLPELLLLFSETASHQGIGKSEQNCARREAERPVARIIIII